jgi:hypothetical protein
MVTKIISNSIGSLPVSTIYSQSEVLIIKLLNEYLIEDTIYNLNDQIKFFEIIQKILEKSFNLSLSNSMIALKVSVAIMSPHVFLSLISKLLHENLK